MQSSPALGFSDAVVWQREVVHSNLNVTGVPQSLSGHFIKRALVAGPGYVFIAVTTLRGFDPWHEREAVERNPIGSQFNRLFNRLTEMIRCLLWQSVDQIVID